LAPLLSEQKRTISPPLSGALEDFRSPGPAAANALLMKVLYVHVTTHVLLSVDMQSRQRVHLSSDN